MELVVEQLTGSNKVLQLFKVTGDTVRIGRAYDNDIILQEEHISPYHAQLTLNERDELILTDLQSLNGIKDASNKQVAVTARVNSGDKFLFGKLTLRIIQASQPVIEAKKLNFLEEFTSKLNRWYWALALSGLLYIHYILQNVLSSVAKIVWPTLILEKFYLVITLLTISLIISAIARIFKKEVKLFSIAVLIMSVILTQQLFSVAGNFLWFNWGESRVLGIGSEILDAGLVFILLWGVFYLASNMNPKRISITSSFLLLSILGLNNLNYFDEDNVSLYPKYNATVLPSVWLITKPINALEQAYISKGLFDAATKEAKRRNVEAEEEKNALM